MADPGPHVPPAPASTLRFSKMHGAGNDFVLLDLRDGARPPSPELCRALADRHAGIGCDQILTIERPRSADAVASYRIWNADGSNAQQCGNGARCIAAWLVRDGSSGRHWFDLDSPTGTHAVEYMGDDRYAIEMGTPQFAPQTIPLAGFHEAQDEYAIDLDGESVRFSAVSMGNPHALIEVLDIDSAPVATLGPRLQRCDAFPESANIGFVEVVARDRIKLRVYERGVGETLACGSGACAAVATLTRRGRVGSDHGVIVSLPGGDLQINYDPESGRIKMAGPTRFVYEGEWPQ